MTDKPGLIRPETYVQDLRALGEVTTLTGYAGLIAIFRQRFDELGITGETSDHLCGFAAGHTTKLFTKVTREHMKRFGPVTLGPILGVLGIKLIAVVDEEALAQLAHRRTPATYRRWRTGAALLAHKIKRNPGSFKNKGHGKQARAIQILTTSPARRRKLGRHAIRARWAKAGK